MSYAKQDAARHDDVHGMGLGYVDVYTPTGHLSRRVASRGDGAGRLRSRGQYLLIGNVGDGDINAFESVSDMPLGPLQNAYHQPIHIDGLWGLAFGNGYAGQPVDTLYFTAGPDGEAHRLYGRVEPARAW